MAEPDETKRSETGICLYDRAVLEAMTLRDTLFAVGDETLIGAIDALLWDLGLTARQIFADRAARLHLPNAA